MKVKWYDRGHLEYIRMFPFRIFFIVGGGNCNGLLLYLGGKIKWIKKWREPNNSRKGVAVSVLNVTPDHGSPMPRVSVT